MASGFPGRTPTPRLLLREGLKPNTLLPSKFQREKLLNTKQEASTGECFLPRIGPCVDMSEIRQKLSPAPPKRSVLVVSPRELVFKDFVAHEVSEMVLSIMNKDKISRMVKISMESSPYFQLACPSDVYHIVPPGASAPVRIRFTPDENKDYSHELTCITAKEKIVVPIRAIGARAILDFPDQLDFSTCPVKHTTQKTLLVRNSGNRTAHYQLSTQSPFSVVPTAGTLGAGDTMQVTVRFHALTNGDHFGSLAVCSNPDEKCIHTKLHGEAVELDVALSTNSVEAGKTFITMVHQTTVFIENRSNITAHFQWKALPTEGDDHEEKRRQSFLLHPSDEDWMENFMEEKEVEKVQGFSEDYTALLRSRVQEMKAKAQKDPLLFSNDVFSIEPMEGEIGPNCSAAIKVTFEPLEALEYRSVAYCNISGCEIRLPLCLRGKGQGPVVELSSPTLDLGKIFIDTPYVYEVKLINQGALDAPFTYIPSTTNVDFCFKIEPERGLIAPGGTQTVQISFHTTIVLGSFEEKFQFSVDGSPTPVILTIKGSVTGPDLHFDLPELDFGDISFGFPCTKSIRLTNCSVVPVTFKLRMSNDGTQPAVSSFDQICKEGDPSWRKGIHFYVEPREFTMNPSQETILPQGHQDIEVTLCSNIVMDFYRRLLVDLEGFGEGVASVVITARCVIPELTVSPTVLLYDECLLKVPYERKLVVVNSTGLPGCYGLILQQPKEDSPVLYSSPKPCGIVQPYSTAEIPVIIEVQTAGEHRTKVLVGVFGDERNPRRVELWSTGQLGEIYPSPSLLEFGRIPALQPTSQSFTLFNKGLVPTDFRVEMASKSCCFVIEPSEGVIPARGEVPVTVTATLDDTVAFDDTVQLFIGNSLWTTVLLQAFGIGTTIVIDKPFAPELNLGYQFSLVPCIHRFKVTNKGRRYHQLFWGAECYSPPEEGGQSVSTLSSLKAKDDSQKPKRASPAFGVQSLTMGLQQGQSEDMVLRGFSRIPQEVQDYVFCDALIGTSLKRERMIETILTCKFIHPSIEVSAREFSFYVEKKPSDVLTLQYQPLSLKNTCLLPLDLMLDLEQPFLVCDKELQPLPGGQPVSVDVGETCHLYIAFDPAYELDFKSWKKEKVLKIDMVRGHPFVERITLQGEVHFPNLQMQPSSLEFGCIGPGTEKVRSLEMTNCSPLPVQYRWSFQSDSEVTRFRDGLCPLKFKPQPPKGKNTSLGSPASRWRHFKMRQEAAARMLKEVDNFTQSLRETVQAAQLPEYPRLRVGFEGVSVSMDEPQTPLQAEEAFSILPMSGVLQPGESQQVSFTFSGHLNTISNVTALCHVEGGPTYKVLVTGEISRLSYLVRPQEINCGLQVFNEIHHSNVTLVNRGKTEFNWVLNPSPADKRLPGVFLVNPTTGSLAPGKKRVLKFSYMPGLPGAFSRTYHLKVGNLEPENICLKGEASFPMISLDLPWNIRGTEKYEKTLKQLIKPLQQDNQRNKSVVLKKTQSLKTNTLKSQTPTTQTLKTQNPMTQDLQPSVLASGTVSDTQLQIKMMRMLIEKAALELQQKLTSHPLKSRFPEKGLCQSLVKVELPQYVLDMGPVLKGYTETHSLKITNPGQIHVSFQVDVSVLQNTGFSVGLDQMICLPPNNSVDFDVHFESAHKPYGDVEVVLPIEVTNGPMYNIHIRATVSELSLTLSKNTLQFSDIRVGQCQVETIQLYNRFPESCKWFIASNKPALKNSHLNFMTPAVRQKLRVLVDEPCPFDVTPSRGTLDPGKWQNLHIQFTPEEERFYKNELELIICGSSNRLKLHLSGQGLEPQLEFSPPALKMGGMLVDSNGVEATVVVKNPCNFPSESYSLDFDEQYLEEEKILRMAAGSEYQKSFFMPPRAVGETLPPEVLQDHEAQRRPKAQEAELKARAEAKAIGKAAADLQWEKDLQRKAERILQMDEDECDALPEEKKAEVDKVILERKPIWRKKELKQMAQKREEEAKALEEEERQKEEKKGVSVGKQPPKPEKGKTKPPEKKETEPPEKKETKPPEKKETKAPEGKEVKSSEGKETKAPERKETKALEKKENKAPEKKETKAAEGIEIKSSEGKETKTPERKETKATEKKENKAPEKKETKIPEKKNKPPEKETKSPERKETKAPEKGEPKTSKKGETKAPEKGGTKAQKKGGAKAPKKGGTEIPEEAVEIENWILRFQICESFQQSFSYWKRVQGTVQFPVIQKANKFQHAAGNKGQKTNKPQEKVKKKPEQKHRDQRNL